MTKEEVLKIVLESPSIPTLPTVALKLISVSSKEDIGMREIANLISKDASLAAKVLKIANSAYYNFPHKISTIHQAVSRLGTNTLRSIALSFSFLSIEANDRRDIFNYKKFWEQSLSNAVAARLLMAEITDSDLEEIFIAGLLQNIGELIIARSLPQLYGQVFSEAANNGREVTELEHDIIGADHTFIGYEVAKNWGFPNVLLVPIQYHHCPENYKSNNKKLKCAVTIVYLSGILTSILYSDNPQKYHQKFLDESRIMLGFDDKSIDRILERVVSETTETANLFGFHIKNTKSVAEILQEANMALSTINLSYDQQNRELVADKVHLQKHTKELEEKNKRLEKLAQLDSLTEVYNHGYFQSFLEKEISFAVRRNSTVSLILADVDHFKGFNDKYGHQTGDFILRELCKLMRKSLRDYDVIARYGGEEFAIVLLETAAQDALIVAEKLRESIAMHDFVYHNRIYHVTVSIGVAVMRPIVDTFTKTDLISFADKALFQSKKIRNSVTLYADQKEWCMNY